MKAPELEYAEKLYSMRSCFSTLGSVYQLSSQILESCRWKDSPSLMVWVLEYDAQPFRDLECFRVFLNNKPQCITVGLFTKSIILIPRDWTAT
jgi:hypothetical protein